MSESVAPAPRSCEVDGRAPGPQHPRHVAAAELRGHALAGKRTARGTAQVLAWRDRNLERVEREFHRPPARHVAVGELCVRDRELQLEIARERAEGLAAAAELQLEATERALDAVKAGEQRREPAERRALRTELERDRRHGGVAVEIEPPGERHPGDGCLERRVQATVLDADMEFRVAHVAGESEPAVDPKRHVGVRCGERGEIDRPLVQRGIVERLAVDRLAAVIGEERPQIECRHLQLARDTRPITCGRHLEMAGELGGAHHAADAVDDHLVAARGHARPDARYAGIRQRGLQQPFELGEVRGAEPEEGLGLARARIHRPTRVQLRACELEAEREGPGLVAAIEEAPRTAVEGQHVPELLLDAAAHCGPDGARPCAFGVQRVEVEEANASAGVVLDGEIAQAHAADPQCDARAFGVRLGLLRERVEHPIPAAVRGSLQPYAHVARLEGADPQPPPQQGPEVDLGVRGAELGERRRREAGRVGDADAADPHRGLQAQHDLDRPFERDLAPERAGRDRRDPVAPGRGIDRDAEERDPEEKCERRGDQRRDRDQPPPHRTVTARVSGTRRDAPQRVARRQRPGRRE